MARLIIDAHVHAQRFTPGFVRRGEPFTYRGLEDVIMSEQGWDNSRMLLADMDRLGIDKACILTAFNMRNEMIHEQWRRHPHRFIPFCGWVETTRREWAGEARFSAEKAAEEIDFWLSRGFVGIGETLGMLPSKSMQLSVDENLRLLWPIMEVARRHQAPVLFHTGCIAYPDTCRLRAVDPILLDDVALAFPDVPIIIGHSGVQMGWYRSQPEHALMVAARHPNVYLELSQCQQEQIERALFDPNIGPDKLLFGSDWGTSISYRYFGRGKHFATYAATPAGDPPNYLPHHFEWNLRQVRSIDMSEDDRAKILGLNMARLCKIHVKAFLQEQEERYGDQIRWEDVTLRWESRTPWEPAEERLGPKGRAAAGSGERRA
jgi:predicted TIM-barrel fold metal-dependent hydrolase